MHTTRRMILTMAGLTPLYSIAGAHRNEAQSPSPSPLPSQSIPAPATDDTLVISDFSPQEPVLYPGASWRGFTDQVMGGVSNAEFDSTEIDGRRCARMTGRVTRDNGGGFVQMALYFNPTADLSAWNGIELLVHGNDEDYNMHIRTADCGWHDQSYRATFRALPRWQTIRLPWDKFAPNGLTAPLDTSRLQRFGLLGWMRDFQADLAVGRVSLYA